MIHDTPFKTVNILGSIYLNVGLITTSAKYLMHILRDNSQRGVEREIWFIHNTPIYMVIIHTVYVTSTYMLHTCWLKIVLQEAYSLTKISVDINSNIFTQNPAKGGNRLQSSLAEARRTLTNWESKMSPVFSLIRCS